MGEFEQATDPNQNSKEKPPFFVRNQIPRKKTLAPRHWKLLVTCLAGCGQGWVLVLNLGGGFEIFETLDPPLETFETFRDFETFVHCFFWFLTYLQLMALFKRLFVDNGKPADKPADWIGTEYQCTVKVVKTEGAAPVLCGCKILSKNSNTTGLNKHIRDRHPLEYEQLLKSQGDITSMFPSSKDQQQRENITLTFAENALPYQLVDSSSFRRAFGDRIPPGFHRKELSHATKVMKQADEAKLMQLLKEKDVFLLVDGGTLNRFKLLNACLGYNGAAYFWKSQRVPCLTAAEVCLSCYALIASFGFFCRWQLN